LQDVKAENLIVFGYRTSDGQVYPVVKLADYGFMRVRECCVVIGDVDAGVTAFPPR
jgi:hypothetical protein